jgi:recombinational DNA repair ATPase RecF
MIQRLTASAIFEKSGASLSTDYQPQTGITAVVGGNGSGKSFSSIEATRWLLYGKAALRGAASDYANAAAAGRFLIRGAPYEISRGKAEWVKDGSGAIVAKGAEQCTAYITAAMGYGLDVFDLCNAAVQGEVNRLGAMRPAERKAIIDKVARLTDAEAAEKACRDEAKGYRREAEALAKTLRAPGDKPAGPRHDRDMLRNGLAAQRALRDQHAALTARLRVVEPPVAPTGDRPSSEAVAQLEAYVDQQRELQRRRVALAEASVGAHYSVEQLEAAAARRAVRQLLADRGDRPTLTADEVAAGFAEVRAAMAHMQSEPVTCPECHHTFRPTGEAPPEPRWSRVELETQERRLRAWPDDGPALPEGLDLTPTEISHARAALDAEIELAKLPLLGANKAGELANLRRLFHHWESYDASAAAHASALTSNAVVEREIAALGSAPSQTDIDDIADTLHAAELAAAALATWEAEDAAFKATQLKIAEATTMAEEYGKGAAGLADARATVKALLAPKISRIASALIRDMSAGKLTSLVLDDDMQITVGNQRIETLSGAGKTVANLALRVAMGQALVGHVFPVFLADEIDGDMDAARRRATLEALVSLKQHLSQIILVTHRGAEIADQVWDVESTG